MAGHTAAHTTGVEILEWEDPSSTPPVAPVGVTRIVRDPTSGQLFISISLSPYRLLTAAPDTVEFIPELESAVNGNSSRGAQANFDGCSYKLLRPITFNRIIINIRGITGAPDGRVLLYQRLGGLGGSPASLIATCDFLPIVANTNLVVTPTEGTVTLETGIFYALFGIQGADSFTYSTYATPAQRLLTSDVDTDTHPALFTTTVAASTAPATIDPREGSPDGVTASAVDIALALRMKSA